MGRKLVIKTVFTASDKTVKSTKSLSNRFEKLSKKIGKSSMGLGKLMGGIVGSRLIIGGLAAIKRGLSAVTSQFVDFDSAITAAGAKFGNAFKRGTKGAEELRKVARGIGQETEFSSTAAAEGLDFLAMAGFNAAQSIKLLPGVVDLATATNLDLARSSDIASDSLGAFGLMSKDSTQLQKNLTRVMDVMAKTTVTANTDMTKMFEAVQKGAPTFTAAGQSLETFGTLVGGLSTAMKGGEAGTNLRNIMLRLANPVGAAQKVLKKLNVTTSDSQGNFRDVIDILADFEKGLEGMGTKQKSAALAVVFGAKAVTGVNVLLKQGTKSLREYRKELTNSQGASKELAEEMRKSLKNQLEKIKSGLTELGFKFFDVFGKVLQKAISFISKFVDKLNKFFAINKKIISGKFDKFLKFLLKIFIKLKPTIKIVSLLLKNIFDKLKNIGQSSQGMLILKVIFDTILMVLNKGLGLINTFINTLSRVAGKLNFFQTFQNLLFGIRNLIEPISKLWKDMLATLEKTGALSLVLNVFKLLANSLALIFKLLKPVISLFGFLFKIIMFALSPIIKLIDKLVSGLNFILNALNKIGRGKDVDNFGGGGGGGDGPLSTNARLAEAGVNTTASTTNIEKSLLEIKGVNLPKDLEFNSSGGLKGISLDVGANK